MFDFTKFLGGSEKDLVSAYYAKSYGVVANAVTIDRSVANGPNVKLYLTVRMGSSPTSGTESYTRLDLATLFAGVDEITTDAISEFRQYFEKRFHIPTDRLEITQKIGNAYVIKAQEDSLLFVGKKTFYVR